MPTTVFGEQQDMPKRTCHHESTTAIKPAKIEKRKQQQGKTFQFIGNAQLKVLETTGNNSMFAVFQYSEKITTSPMEGVLLLNGVDMLEGTSTNRRKVSKPSTTRKSKKKEIVQHVTPMSDSSTPMISTSSPISEEEHLHVNHHSATTTSYSKPPYRSSISIKEILN